MSLAPSTTHCHRRERLAGGGTFGSEAVVSRSSPWSPKASALESGLFVPRPGGSPRFSAQWRPEAILFSRDLGAVATHSFKGDTGFSTGKGRDASSCHPPPPPHCPARAALAVCVYVCRCPCMCMCICTCVHVHICERVCMRACACTRDACMSRAGRGFKLAPAPASVPSQTAAGISLTRWLPFRALEECASPALPPGTPPTPAASAAPQGQLWSYLRPRRALWPSRCRSDPRGTCLCADSLARILTSPLEGGVLTGALCPQ